MAHSHESMITAPLTYHVDFWKSWWNGLGSEPGPIAILHPSICCHSKYQYKLIQGHSAFPVVQGQGMADRLGKASVALSRTLYYRPFMAFFFRISCCSYLSPCSFFLLLLYSQFWSPFDSNFFFSLFSILYLGEEEKIDSLETSLRFAHKGIHKYIYHLQHIYIYYYYYFFFYSFCIHIYIHTHIYISISISNAALPYIFHLSVVHEFINLSWIGCRSCMHTV